MSRMLSLIEHMVCVASDTAPINFVLTARIEGELTEAMLRTALTHMRERHPLLGVGVMEGENGRFCYKPSPIPKLPLRIVARESDSTWERETEREIKTFFDWHTGPLVRFVWVQGEFLSELLVVCHHAIADGLSAMYVIHDIMQVLGNPKMILSPLPLLPPVEEMIPESIAKHPVMRAKTIAVQGIIKLLPLLSKFKRKNTAHAFLKEPPDLTFQMISWMLDEETTTAVVARAKQENTTVHGALGAAFLKAFATREGKNSGWEREVSSPVSLRNRLAPPVGEDFGLFIALVDTKTNCQPERNFWDIARNIKQKLTQGSTDGKVFFQPLISRNLEPSMADLGIFGDFTNITYDLSITNLGRFNFPTSYGTLYLQAIFGPVVTTLENERILGVATVGGKLCFTFVFQPKDMSRAYAKELQAQAMTFLTEATA